MKNMTKLKSVIACVCMVFLVALAIVPMFTFTASAADGAWNLVTDASTLEAGDQIVIVASTADYALSTNQKTSNRGATAITKNADKTITISNDTEIITLEAGKSEGTFAFKVSDGYLYAASSSGNQLKTKTTLDVHGSWKITVTSDVASITAPDSSNRNVMQYNPNASNNSPLFACYSSASQQDLAVYKFVETVGGCEHKNTSIVDKKDPTCTEIGHTGKTVCNDCGNAIDLGEELAALGHNYVGEKCSVCGEAKPTSLAGKYYIATIRSSGNYWYMTSDLGTSSTKRYQAVDSGLTTLPESIASPADGYAFILEENDDGTYIIYVDGTDDYLGYTSGNSGTIVAKENAKKFEITANEDGTYQIAIVDTDRILALNANTGNDYFAFYTGSGCKDMHLIPVGEDKPEVPECEHDTNEFGYCTKCQVAFAEAQLKVGKNLSMIYTVDLFDSTILPEGTTLAVKFYKAGKELGIFAPDSASEGKYTFTLNGIAPQEMMDTLDAILVAVDTEGNAVKPLAALKNYTVKAYLDSLLADEAYNSDAKLVQLVKDIIAYGGAAQQFTGHNTDNLVSEGNEGASTATPGEGDKYKLTQEVYDADNYFNSANVFFDTENKIVVKFTATAGAKLVVKAGETVIATVDAVAGVNEWSTDSISATEFDKVFTFELQNAEGILVQTVTYSVNSYCYSMKDIANNDAMKALAIALYNYGVSSKAYAG